MPATRKNHPPSLKAKVAVEAIQGHKITTQIAQKFGVHPPDARMSQDHLTCVPAGAFPVSKRSSNGIGTAPSFKASSLNSESL